MTIIEAWTAFLVYVLPGGVLGVLVARWLDLDQFWGAVIGGVDVLAVAFLLEIGLIR